MKIRLLILLIFAAALNIYGQQKSDYDLIPEGENKAASLSKAADIDPVRFKNSIVDIAMVSGGYFTLGTTGGTAPGTLDDNCQLTFGHPYALTSYPVFSIDGQWFKPEEYFTAMSTVKSGDTLKLTAEKAGVLSLSFLIYYDQIEGSVRFSQKLRNLDSRTHTAAMGLIYDPGMGMNGDACIEQSGTILNESRIYQPADIPAEMILWEKKTGAKGLTAGLSFMQTPSMIIAHNWNDLYMFQEPAYPKTGPVKLYDLLLKVYWPEGQLNAGAEDTKTAKLRLRQPDINAAALLRWDLPFYIAMNNKLMFPQDLKTYVQILQKSGSSLASPKLKLELSQELTTAWTEKNLSVPAPSFAAVDYGVKIQYVDAVAEAAVKLYDGTTLVDEIRRNIFIPYTPVSDTGLTVAADTLMTSKFPDISMVFNVTNKQNGGKLTALTEDNIFLYENGQRITNFKLAKDTTGGSTATDIVFALDVTGSMGNVINSVKNNIIEFADSLSRRGIDYRLGLVTFLDEIENIYPFTRDVQAFQNIIGQQSAHGGGDANENSLQALMECQKFPFRPEAKRLVIWITDIGYHENDNVTKLVKKTVIDSLLLKGITVHAIGGNEYKQQYYDPIITAVSGNFYSITGNFRDIMLDISRMKSIYKYLLNYKSAVTQKGTNEINLKIRYAGLGGSLVITYNNNSAAGSAGRLMSYYPNPFNPEITFNVNKRDFKAGKIRIFDIMGRLVNEFSLDSGNSQKVVWNATNMKGEFVSAGFYITELMLTGADKSTHIETAKIMYLK